MTSSIQSRRIVAVQGGVQLVSAVATLREVNRAKNVKDAENHLVVHDLSSPGDQGAEFAECLFQLARKMAPFASFRYITLQDILGLQASMKPKGWQSAIDLLHNDFGFETCDELYLGQNLQYLNNLLARAYPTAKRSCYGDGIGLNFSYSYFRPSLLNAEKPPNIGKRMERWVRRKIKGWLGKPLPAVSAEHHKQLRHAVTFDEKFLLLANHFDEKLDRYRQLLAYDFVDLFSKLADDCELPDRQDHQHLGDSLTSASEVVVLLTSNFSETKRMTLVDEVTACLDLVQSKPISSGALLVIKPHPRDSYEKIQKLIEAARPHFQTVISLSDPQTFYVPFESLYVKYLQPLEKSKSVRIICTSSACISLEYLYGKPCELGFGAGVVQRIFSPNWRFMRNMHERDLHRLTRFCRARHLKKAVA